MDRRELQSRFQPSLAPPKHFLNSVDRLLVEKRLPALRAYPSWHLIDDEVISLAAGGIADSLTHQLAFAVETFHQEFFMKVRTLEYAGHTSRGQNDLVSPRD